MGFSKHINSVEVTHILPNRQHNIFSLDGCVQPYLSSLPATVTRGRPSIMKNREFKKQ